MYGQIDIDVRQTYREVESESERGTREEIDRQADAGNEKDPRKKTSLQFTSALYCTRGMILGIGIVLLALFEQKSTCEKRMRQNVYFFIITKKYIYIYTKPMF